MQRTGRGWPIVALAILCFALLLLHLSIGGSFPLTPGQIVGEILRGPGGSESGNVVVWELRLPRAFSAALIGALLACVGASFQALFRNPLAEPYVIGVSSGSALGGTVVILVGAAGLFGGLLVPLAGFAGGLAALGLVLLLGLARSGEPREKLLVAGVVIGSLLSALTSLTLLLSGQDTNQVLRWLLGSVTPATWPKVAGLVVVLGCCLPILMVFGRRLNAMAMSEDAAFRSGVDVKRVRNWVLVTGTAGAAASVGSAGVIPFVGLVAPHISRRWVGEDLRLLLPASALTGACLLIASDLLAQRLQLGTELPVGAVTAVLGAPVLLALIGKK